MLGGWSPLAPSGAVLEVILLHCLVHILCNNVRLTVILIGHSPND